MQETKRSIEDLLDRFGSPLYVFDERGFIENYRALESAMKARYDRYCVAYSFKTNYTPYICKTAKSLGAYAEVVSGMEYTIAKRIGYEDSQVIFNGPCKGKEGVEAFLKGCLVNVDSLDELERLCEATRSCPERTFKIGLRINLSIGQEFISRFGMDEEDTAKAFHIVEKVGNLKIAGLHCHISRCRGLEAWKRRTETMLDLSDRFFSEPPEFLDLGSGMFGSMAPEFAAQFNDVPTYEDYAAVTAGVVSEHYKGEKRPILFTEPGTTLVNRFVKCITRVDSIKQINSHWFAVLDAGTQTLGETCTLKRLPVKVVPGGVPQKEYENIDLTGYTCLEQDVVLKGFRGKLSTGDYLIFGNVGGYSNVLKPPFIRPGCAMVAEKPDGDYRLIKAAETCYDLLKTYEF